MSIFSKRHYEFLAEFAGHNLSKRDYTKLAVALNEANSNFKLDVFISRCDDYQRDLHSPEYLNAIERHNSEKALIERQTGWKIGDSDNE